MENSLSYINDDFETFESEVIDQGYNIPNKVIFQSGAFSMALHILDELNDGTSPEDLIVGINKFIGDLSEEIIENSEQDLPWETSI